MHKVYALGGVWPARALLLPSPNVQFIEKMIIIDNGTRLAMIGAGVGRSRMKRERKAPLLPDSTINTGKSNDNR